MSNGNELNKEYRRLMKELKDTPADYNLLTKIKRKARSLFKMAPKGQVVTKKRFELDKRLDEIEREMLK